MDGGQACLKKKKKKNGCKLSHRKWLGKFAINCREAFVKSRPRAFSGTWAEVIYRRNSKCLFSSLAMVITECVLADGFLVFAWTHG
ncbi:hypothetical protein QG37_06951 [Candidozyma auris]|uniref:Uncharacterized protein n=1 Tax=Candidozyma auris TaxID=498019 RepID=A0A0L0NRI0_CANAR|nr:hypothetical protein QG37_06951 [[Candida] auris]